MNLRYPARLVFCALILLLFASIARGAIIINAPMTDTNSSGWVLGGNPTSALLTGNGSIDPSGSGWLRLTNNTGDQTGFAYNTTSFDLSAGVLIQFDYATWGGSGADGYSVYLFDANVPTFNIGAFGGSLGYAQKSASASCNPAPSNVPGISGGYMGIGVDEFGNFAYGCEGRYLGGSQRANTVTLRGSVVGFGGGAVGQTQNTTSYPWIATSATSGTSLWYNGGTRPGQTGTDYRKVIIRISPAPNPVADVWIQFGYNTAPVQMISGQALPPISASQQLRVGYAASTGGSTNYHEIRNLLITTLDTMSSVDLGITKTAVSTGTSTAISSALVGDSFQYLVSARNYGPNAGNIPAAISDSFPSYLTPGSWTCSATGGANCGAASGTGNLGITASLPMNGTVTYRVNATLSSLPPGNLLTNTATVDATGVTDFFPGNDSASSTITAYQAPIVTQSFIPASVVPGSPSQLRVTITNPNNIAATGLGFTDSYPSLLLNAGAGSSPQCGGTITAANNGRTLRLAGGSVAANSSCTITVNVDSTTANSYTIPASSLSTATLGTGTVPAATLVVMAKPTVAESFTPSQVGVSTPSTLTVTLTNPNDAAVTGAAFTSSYPAGLTNTATPNPVSSCGGTVTAAAGGGSLALSGGTIPANGSCTVTVNVNGVSAGSYTNSTGTLTTANSGTGTAASATLTVLNPPTVAKSFSAATILPGGNSTLTVTLTNPNSTAITGAAFTDTYPTGLFNAAAPAGSTTCTGGTVDVTGGGASLALSGGTIPANGSCTVRVTTTSAAAGTYVNSTGSVSTTNAGSGSAASGTLVVMAPPTATKAFSPIQITIGGTTTLSVTLTNPNSVAITGAGFTDSYPSGMLNKAAPAVTNSCGGTVTAAGSGGSLALSGGTVPAGGSCTVSVNVTINAVGNFTNSTGSITTGNAGSGSAASANLNGPQPPGLSAVFAPATIPSGTSSLYTLTLSNPNSFDITGAAFSDSYPAGLINASPAGGATSCAGGTVTAANGGNSLSLSGATIPAGGSCTVTVNMTGAPGSYTDSTGAVTTANTPAGSAASATLTVLAPPSATKSFSPASVLVNTPSLMTITLSNPNPNATALTGVGFTDSYPAGLINMASASGSTTCSGGSVTLTGSSIALSGASIPPSGSCTVTVNVTSASAGSYLNSTGPVASDNGGNGSPGSATLTATVLPAPGVTMSFAPGQVPLNGTSLLTVTLTNPSATAITGAAFTDGYPGGLVNTGTPAPATSCGGTVSASAGGSTLSLSDGTIPAGGSCTVTVNVTSASAASYLNSTGAVTTTNSVAGAAASATLAVLAPPTVAASFTPGSIVVNTVSVYTVTLSNPNTTAISGAAFSASYPSGLVNAASAGGSTTCAGGTVTAANGGNSLALSGGTIPAGGSCTVSVNTTSASTGSYPLSTGVVSTSSAGNGSAASATLSAILQAAPTAVKSFSPTQIAKNGSSVLSVTLSNPNGVAVTGVAFSDTLPTTPGQMSIPAGAVLTSSCGGTGTIAGNKLSFSIAGGTIPANGSCTVSVTVTAGTLGTYNNTTSTVTSNNSFTGAAASASLTVALLAPPTVVKSFAPNQIGIGGSSLMTITLSNPNSSAITGAAFTDSYPGGLVNSTPANGSNSCGGTLGAVNGDGSLTLSGATIPASSSCSVSVNVTSGSAGSYTNSTGTVTTGNASSGSAASATLNVLQAPIATKSFSPAAAPPGTVSVMTVTLRNPNGIAITGAGFTDTYPAGLSNTASAAAATTCTGATVSAANNGTSLTLSGATIPGGASCTATVNVKVASAGSYLNSTGTIASGNAGSGAAATGTLVAMAPPTVSKAFVPAAVQTGTPSTLTITLTNPNPADITAAAISDSYPSGLLNTASPNGATTCGGGTVSAAGSGNSLALSGGTVPAGGSCTVTASVTSASPGSYSNTTGAVTTGNAGTGSPASATLSTHNPPTVAKSFGTGAISQGGTTTLVLTLANPGANPATLTGVQVADAFPAGLALQNTSFSFAPAGCGSVTNGSGGPSAPGDTGARFSVSTLAVGGSCQVTLNVTGTGVGNLTNTTGAPVASGPASLSGSSASASLTVNALPLISILKSASVASASPGQVIVYTVQVINSGAGTGTNVVLTDDLSPYGSFFLNGGTPFSFTDSAPASGLTLGAPQYSSNNGGSWVYAPSSGSGGAPAGYDANVTNWRMPMNGSIRPGGSFSLSYQVIVK